MPRRRRGFLDHSCYHITHRCHNRAFLLKFARDRDKYYKFLLETNRRYNISFLDYVITSNHVHFLIWVRHGEVLGEAMRFLQGSFAQHYNKTHKREGAFWSDRYHSTLIQSGEHFGRCLFYIDLNMLRSGAVDEIARWRHTAFHEYVGARRRYRLIDMKRLLTCLGGSSDLDGFRKWYMSTLQQKASRVLIARVNNKNSREHFWTESYAVGERDWLASVYDHFNFKRKKIITTCEYPEIGIDEPPLGNAVREPEISYYIQG